MTATKIFFSVLLCCWSFIGFSAETPYKNNVISVTIPDKWHITEEKNNDDDGIVVIKKKGFFTDAAVIVRWYKHRIDAIDDLSNWATLILQGSGINDPIPPPVKARYGNYDADKIALDVRLYLLLALMRYEFYDFTVGEHSISITQFGAKKQKANQAGFDIVEQSFLVLE